jgi:hypothetical protein
MSIKGKLAFAVVMAAATVIAIGATSGGAAEVQTISVHEAFTNATENIDVGKKGPSQGDFMAWNDPLTDLKTGKLVGHTNGTCFLVDVAQQLYNCPAVDFVFNNGAIWASGLLSLKGAPVPDVYLGSGAFANDHHFSLSGKPIGTNAENWTFTINR